MRAAGGVVLALAVVAVAMSCSVSAAPIAAGAPMLGVVGYGVKTRLVELDPRTLQPLGKGSPTLADIRWSARSPDCRRVALATTRGILIADPARGSISWIANPDTSRGIVWLSTGRGGDPLLVAIGASGYGYEYAVIGPGPGGGTYDTDAAPFAVLGAGLVTSEYDPRFLYLFNNQIGGDTELDLFDMPTGSFAVATDVQGDRLFVASAAGLVGEVDHVSGSQDISYHTVDLGGKPFKAAWAGNGRVALWGADGLGVIDTNTWTAHAIAPGITDALPTAYGVLAWRKSHAGLALYRPGGELRFRVLTRRTVTNVVTGDRYAYATTTSGRFSIDLQSGLITGPLSTRARLLPPSFVPAP